MRYHSSSEHVAPHARLSQRTTRPLMALGIVLLLLTLMPIAPAAATPRLAQAALPGSFAPGPCPIEQIEGLRLDCGYLTVAESRRNFTGKTIRLAVAILRSPNPNPAPDPVVFLAGGPGQGTVELAPALAQVYAPLLAERDMVLMDQRGTGFAQPRLDCPTNLPAVGGRLPYSLTAMGGRLPLGLAAANERPAVLQFQVDALLQCGAALRAAGIDLSAYNSVENAADLEDLRRALGYGPWNLFGGSYGTRLALTAMRYRPETLRSVVLDSVYPLQANFHVDVFTSYNNALGTLFAACAADPACGGAYPNLEARYEALIARLNVEPAQVPIINPENGELVTYLPITGVDMSLLIFQLMYITQIIPLLPGLIDFADRGNYETIGVLLFLLFSGQGGFDPIAEGMQTAVQCNEDAPFASETDFVVARDRNRRASPLAFNALFNEAVLEICAAWGLSNPDPAEQQAVTSDLPTMITTGQLDPITPPAYARAAAETLPNSFIVEYPRGGHTPTAGSPCLTAAIAAFLSNPAARPDTSCIAQEGPIPFIVP